MTQKSIATQIVEDAVTNLEKTEQALRLTASHYERQGKVRIARCHHDQADACVVHLGQLLAVLDTILGNEKALNS